MCPDGGRSGRPSRAPQAAGRLDFLYAEYGFTGPEVVPDEAEEWIGEIRPLIGRSDGSPALWPTERADRISLEYIDHRFQAARGALGLPDGLDFHSLRRSYVTHLIEDGWDPFFVQQQVGHEHASTTSIYAVS
jgi:integrase/recombinase XerC